MKARVTVTLKPDVLDPQGEAIESALRSLHFDGVARVRQGKVFDIELDPEGDSAPDRIDAMCRSLLANLVIEDYAVEIVPE